MIEKKTTDDIIYKEYTLRNSKRMKGISIKDFQKTIWIKNNELIDYLIKLSVNCKGTGSTIGLILNELGVTSKEYEKRIKELESVKEDETK